MKAIYKIGDVTNPVESGKVMIAHGCNDSGIAGAGVIIAIQKKWPNAIGQYRMWANLGYYKETLMFANNIAKEYVTNFRLGENQIVKVADNTYVANMITQRHVGMFEDLIPFRYQSFHECLIKLRKHMEFEKFNHLILPRIGAGLAMADWSEIEKIINKVFDKSIIGVTIYDREEDNWPNTVYVK